MKPLSTFTAKLWLCALVLPGSSSYAQTLTPTEITKDAGTIVVTGSRPTSLPSQIPSTGESVTAAQIATAINATDSEDALKYLPSLLIRKRFASDYNHAVLASRASGVNNSARSVVYADGMLLSNFLGNGASYAPRWMMVSPEQIERVDVLYGPFSAAYAGNSVGAIVEYQIRMPTAFESHAKVSHSTSPYRIDGSSDTAKNTQANASIGNKSGDWSWWLSVNRNQSLSQPMVFVTKTPSACAGACTGSAVNGVVLAQSATNTTMAVLGTNTNYETQQDHLKAKLAYALSPTLKLAYTLGYWHNDSRGRPQSSLTNTSTGAAVYSGNVNSGGYNYTLTGTDFAMSNEALTHLMHGLSLKSNTKGRLDYEVALSQYRYAQDDNRAPTSYANGLAGSAGTLQDQRGSGWTGAALKGTYRPDGLRGAHILDFGYQQDAYKLSILRSNTTAWESAAAGSLVSDVGGHTQLQSLWAQDTWRVDKGIRAVLGLRAEQWQAFGGHTVSTTLNTPYAARNERALSPKAALSIQASTHQLYKAAFGRAVRFPTAQELYGSTTTAAAQFVNDPNLLPEKSNTLELTTERYVNTTTLRATAFFEDTRNSLYSQTTAASGTNITRVQNVGRIRTRGLELAANAPNALIEGLDLLASLTYTESKVVENAGFVAVAGDTLGSYQPRVPLFRASAQALYKASERLSTSLGMRHSSKQYTTLNNSDANGFAYTGASKFFVLDARVRYALDKETSLAVGIDNLNNYQYWNFHPYPSRTLMLELKTTWK